MAGVSDEGGLVWASGAFRFRGKVGCVCFDEQSVDGNLSGGIAKQVVFLVGEHTGEADIQSHVDVFEGVFEGCAERVHDPSDRSMMKLVLKDGEHFIIAISRVDDYGQAGIATALEVTFEIGELGIPR